MTDIPTLEELTLNSAKVTDASIEPLSRMKRLRKLNLGGTTITAAGKQLLLAALPKTAIRFAPGFRRFVISRSSTAMEDGQDRSGPRPTSVPARLLAADVGE